MNRCSRIAAVGFYGCWSDVETVTFTAPEGGKLLSIQAWYEGELFGRCTDGTINYGFDPDGFPCFLLWNASVADDVESVTLSDSVDAPNSRCIRTPVTVTLVRECGEPADDPGADLPKTGDATNVALLSVLMLVGAAGIILGYADFFNSA